MFRSHYCLIANRKETQCNNQPSPLWLHTFCWRNGEGGAHLEDNKHIFPSRPELLWTSALNIMLTTETTAKKHSAPGQADLFRFFSRQNLQTRTSAGSSSHMLSQFAVFLRKCFCIVLSDKVRCSLIILKNRHFVGIWQ